MSDRQSFLDFVRDMVQYLDGEWRIEQVPGCDYLKLRGEGLAVLEVFNEGDTRVSVRGWFEIPGNYEESQRFGKCVGYGDKDGLSTSHPMTSARRAAARVNAFLPTYYAALQRTVERKMEHDRAFEQAQRLADELVQVSQGTLKRYNESWEDCKVVLHDTGQVPGVNLELEVREKDIRISSHTNCLPHDLARLLAVWLLHWQHWHGEYQRLASQ